MVRIPNTLEVGEIWVSESMLDDAMQNPNIKILTEAAPMPFDEHGNLW